MNSITKVKPKINEDFQNFMWLLKDFEDITESKFVIVPFKQGKPEGRNLFLDDLFLDELEPSFFEDNTREYFVTLNPRKPDKASLRFSHGGRDTVKAVVGFMVDLDIQDEAHPSGRFKSYQEVKDRLIDVFGFDILDNYYFFFNNQQKKHHNKILRLIEEHSEVVFEDSESEEEIQILPTMVTKTGHGIQMIFYLSDPVILSPEGFKQISEALARKFNGDAVTDISRLFRLPFSWNLKSEPVQSELIFCDPDNLFSIEQIKEFVKDSFYSKLIEKAEEKESELLSKVIQEIDSQKVERDISHINQLKVSNDKKDLILHGWLEGVSYDGQKYPSRSEAINAVVFSLLNAGYNYREVFEILTNRDFGISEKILEEKKTEQSRKEYIARSIVKWLQNKNNKNDDINEDLEKETLEKKLESIVLGVRNFDIGIWTEEAIKFIEVSKLKPEHVFLVAGIKVSKDMWPEVKDKIIELANQKGEIHDKPIGSGIWKFDEEFVLISKRAVFEFNPNTNQFTKISQPTYRNHIITQDTDWFELDEDMLPWLLRSDGNELLKDVFSNIHDKVNTWNWEDKEASRLVTLLVMLSPFQTLLEWRPWIYVFGKRGVGKSFLFHEIIKGLFGDLALVVGNTSLTGIHQILQNTGKILTLDNFEFNVRNKNVLDDLQSLNRGGASLRGSASGKAVVRNLHHLVWLNGISPATEGDNANESRTIQFKLNSHTGEGFYPWTIYERKRILNLLFFGMSKCWKVIENKRQEIIHKNKQYGRLIENLAYVLAIQSIVLDEEPIIPKFLIQQSEEETNLLEELLLGDFTHKFYDSMEWKEVNKPVLDILSEPESFSVNRKLLWDFGGVTIIRSKSIGKENLFIHPRRVCEKIFKGRLDPKVLKNWLLLNIEGSEATIRKVETINGFTSVKGILIPESAWKAVKIKFEES